ncbi:MAG: 7-carboxy-7-deazaguanine synthase QueE [Paludibacteraceae bacterium]|nr:7-carboxy-7-deazaguanine synthase QueE [Paludibacteraceae bacterium]
MSYRVNEIFYTLQGEGAHSGIPAVFVRFSGCNLCCPWCDTDFSSHTDMSAEDIVDEVLSLYDIPNERRRMVVLTGGEPSLQVDRTLIDALHTAGFYICIETNGTHSLPEGIDWITCSPKVMAKGEGQRAKGQIVPTKLALKRVNEVKVVFTGEYDPDIWRTQLEAEHWMLQPLHYTGEWLLRSGVDEWEDDRNDNLPETVRYILSHPFWRLSVQLHKIAGIR